MLARAGRIDEANAAYRQAVTLDVDSEVSIRGWVRLCNSLAERRAADVEPRLLLAHLLRQGFRLTGTHTGCDTTNCGACTVLYDGSPVKSCAMLAVQADGRILAVKRWEANGIFRLHSDGSLDPAFQGPPDLSGVARLILQRLCSVLTTCAANRNG